MTSPTTENIRLTITVTPEVHEVFKRFSAAAGMSLGKAMGEWLGDTIESAEFVASKMEEARAAPQLVLRQMNALALGMADESTALLDQFRMGSKGERTTDRAAGGGRPGINPPSSNTGGKVLRRSTVARPKNAK